MIFKSVFFLACIPTYLHCLLLMPLVNHAATLTFLALL